MSFTIYDNVLDLPVLDVDPGDEAFVRENNTFYLYEDLSLSTTYSYQFAGLSSYLSIPDVLDEFPNSTDAFTINFWDYSSEEIKNPVFTMETPTISYSFEDALDHSLDITGNPKSFYISPYDSDVTSEYFSGSDRIRVTDIQSDMPDRNKPYNIEYWTRASNTGFTLFSSYKTDKDESILEINSSGIVTNGVNLTGDISYETNSWQHNRLLYDGFDYLLYQNGELKTLNYPNANTFDSDDEIGFQDVDVFRDVGFECKVTFPSVPSNGVLFEIGGTENRVRVELINGGNTLFFTAGDVSMNLSVSITSFPKDDLEHIVSWDIQIDPRRIRLWIDGEIKGESSSSLPINSNLWATTDKIGSLDNATGFTTSGWRTLNLIDGGRKYYAATNSGIDSYTAKGSTFDKSGDKIYYLEMQMDYIRTRYRLNFFVLDPSVKFRWRMTYYIPRNQLRYRTIYWYHLHRQDTISIFISEINSRVYFFRNGAQYLGSLFFGGITRTTGLQYGIESYYNNPRFNVAHAREYWKYDPLTFNSSIIDVGPEGSYGSDLIEGVSSNPWPGELLSQLRMYPQCISELSEGSFTVGNRYKPSSNSNSNYYRGYVKDFHLSKENVDDFLIDSSQLDSDYVDSNYEETGIPSLLSTPEVSITETPTSEFLLKSDASGGVLLSYETDGTLKVLGKSYQVDSQHDPFQWKHKTISYDGSVIKVFDNGILEYKDSVDFSPYSLSDATLNIGRGTFINYDNATYNNYFLEGNISDFRILNYSIGDSDFVAPSSPYSADSTVLLTANKSAVENDQAIINVNSVSSTETSPYSATTRRWFTQGNLSTNLVNIDYVNDHFIYEYPDSFSNSNDNAISSLIELKDKDEEGADLFWKSTVIQDPNPVISVKQIDNKFLVEPIVGDDSHASRNVFLTFTGYRADSNIPVVSTSSFEPVVNDLVLDFNYSDEIVELSNRNNVYILNYFDIYNKDSDIDSDFRNVSPLPYRTWYIPLDVVDSIGDLP